jgi:nucleotide-binding universal stress UspA family protein
MMPVIATGTRQLVALKKHTVMKTILIATDFSDAAHNASLYGVELAKAFNARVILFCAYQQVPVPITETPVLTLEEMSIRTQRQLEMEAKAINKRETVILETIHKEGTATSSILEAAKQNNADIIITGMKGSGKNLRKVFGSTASALAAKSTIPLIVVPEEAQFSRIDTIALANESDIEPDADVHLLDALREIAEIFQPKLYLVRIAQTRFREAFEILNRPFKLIRLMQSFDPVYESIEGRDIPKALNQFIESYHVNMLAMLAHKHSLPERWFIKSTTRSMVFESHIPLLILPDRPA